MCTQLDQELCRRIRRSGVWLFTDSIFCCSMEISTISRRWPLTKLCNRRKWRVNLRLKARLKRYFSLVVVVLEGELDGLMLMMMATCMFVLLGWHFYCTLFTKWSTTCSLGVWRGKRGWVCYGGWNWRDVWYGGLYIYCENVRLETWSRSEHVIIGDYSTL